MPLPKPGDSETQSEFISRCMSDETMNEEYSDRDQRSAVCYTQWRQAKGKSLSAGKQEDEGEFYCECLECEHKFYTDEHCDQATCPECGEKHCRRVERPGPGKRLEKDTRYELPSPQPKLDVGGKAEDAGWLSGYASVFNNVDLQDEVVRPGAFRKTISERVPAGKVKLMARHMASGGDTLEVVGTVTEAKEDEHGLWIHAEFSGSATAQEVRRLVAEGHVSGLSIGYIPVDWGYAEVNETDIVELKELKLLEVTITALPANELAVVRAAKVLGDAARRLHDTHAPSKDGATEDRVLSEANCGRIKSTLDALKSLSGELEALLKDAEPKGADKAAAHSAYVEVKRRWLALQRLSLGADTTSTERSEPE